jgi:beta-glucosidase-like glycosyl hydrolase
MRPTDINKLSVEEKIGQLVMSRLDFNDPGSLPLARKLVAECHVGGFIIFGGTRENVKQAARELEAASRIPLFFACDAERGVGQIVSGTTLFPFTMSLGAIGDEELVYRQASLIAGEMRGCGLNLVLAPVADINTNPDNPIINIRSYGDDPGLVSRLSLSFIKGLRDNGILSCAKHFPGHGATGVDSHIDMPVSDQSAEDLFRRDLIPFQTAVDGGVTCIMPAHIAYPEISGEKIPATISEALIKGILRDRLGFGGLVVTDSFRMEGIGKSGDEADMSGLALKSGCDIILDPKEPETLIRRLIGMAESGELDEATLNEAVIRIAEVKNKRLAGPASDSINIQEDTNSLKVRIVERSPCLLKGGRLKSENALVYVFDVTGSERDISGAFMSKMKEAGVTCKRHAVGLTDDAASVISLSHEYDSVICLIYTTVGAWKKESFLPGNYRSVLTKLETLPHEKVLVSFGSPYVVSGFGGFDTALCVFDTMDGCQAAAGDVLTGKIKAGGVMPVKL